MPEYRILRGYNDFFARNAYELQKRCRFLFWKYWKTISYDALGMNVEAWKEHYHCEIEGHSGDG